MNGNRDPLLTKSINPRWWRLPGWRVDPTQNEMSASSFFQVTFWYPKWRSRFLPWKRTKRSFTNGRTWRPWVLFYLDDVHLSGFAELLRALNHFDPQQAGDDNVGRWSPDVKRSRVMFPGSPWYFKQVTFLGRWKSDPNSKVKGHPTVGYKKVMLNHLGCNLLGGWAPSGM